MLTSPSRRRQDGDLSPDTAIVRVLLVDDDDNFRTWMVSLMRRLGFTVEDAVNGIDALARLETSTFDLVVADFEMPKMNGLELIHEIRASPHLNHQYAVMLTSHDDLDSKIDALSAGYDDFLTKSCTEVEVVAKVVAAKRMLARQRMLSVAAHEWQVLATRDELTGVASRRTLVTEADRTLAASHAVGLAILDLDDFKPVNDTYGHLTGDRILGDLGALFLQRTRAQDLIARFGGDEFVLLVVDQTMEDLIGAAGRLVREIDGMRWSVGDATLAIHITCGIAHSSLMEDATFDKLLETADRDLYAKKWIKKHPGERLELYEYPNRATGATIVPIPTQEPVKKPGVR